MEFEKFHLRARPTGDARLHSRPVRRPLTVGRTPGLGTAPWPNTCRHESIRVLVCHLGSRGKHTTQKITACNEAEKLPILSTASLLDLAHWCQKQREITQGGVLCHVTELFPPAPTEPGRSCPPESVLGGVAPRKPTANTASIESVSDSTTAAPARTGKAGKTGKTGKGGAA